jgi:hypothetical protein
MQLGLVSGRQRCQETQLPSIRWCGAAIILRIADTQSSSVWGWNCSEHLATDRHDHLVACATKWR